MPACRLALLTACLAVGGCGARDQRRPVRDTVATSDAITDSDRAAAVIREYYAAIGVHDYVRAWRLWDDSGRASHQSLAQFTAGYANTDTVTVTVGAPGRVEGAAGSRFVTIPVAIRAVSVAGDSEHYAGDYVLRRVVVDGATADQRRWHLFSASIHPEP